MNHQTRLCILLLLLVATHLNAQGPIPTRSRTVAPGVVHSEYTLAGPLTYDVLEVTLNNPYIRLETYRPNGLTRTTLQSAANDRDGHRVIGAVNADFFSFETGWPTGNQIVNSTFVLGVSSSRSHFALDAANRPLIERLAFRGRVVAANGTGASIGLVNEPRAAGTMVFYTGYRGATTLTDGSGMECAVRFVATNPPMADTLLAVVTAQGGAGNMAIPANGGVISGASGTPATFLSTYLTVGDTVKIFLGFSLPLRQLTQAIGGAGRIIMNGRNVTDSMAVVEGIGTAFTGARHPRTFFAINQDTTKAYLCTVDGRQASSIGATFGDMAGFLLSIGAWDGFNFDGGGSTTMVVRGEVTNSPSDPGGERSVANSLHVVSTAPLGTLNYLDLTPSRAEAFQGGTIQFNAAGTDEFYNPVPLPPSTVWEADPAIGTISSTGFFSAQTTNDSGWIRVRWNSVADSAFVVVRTLTTLYVTPPALNMVPGEQVTLQIRGKDTGGNRALVGNHLVSFSSSHSSLNVNQSGQCTATDFGNGTVSVNLQGLISTIPFNQTGNDTTILLDGFSDLFPWEGVLRTNCDSLQATIAGSSDAAFVSPPGVSIQYAVPALPASISWLTTLPLSGRPDSLLLDVYGSGNGDSLQIYIEDKDGDPFVVPALGRVTWNAQWRSVGFRMNRAVSLTGKSLDYPITLRRIIVNFSNLSGSATGVILIDGLKAHYPLRVVTPQLLFDFESGTSGWQSPTSNNTAQMKGIVYASSQFQASTDVAYQGSYCGKWTFVDDAASSVDWDVRITRLTNFDLGLMLRGSYVGAWVYSNGNSEYQLQTVIRDGNGQVCAGPVFPVNHFGWKLIGTRLEGPLFTPYLTSGQITDANNKYNGFRVRALNSVVSGKTKTVYIDKLVTSALTVPSGYHAFSATWSAPLARLHWVVNSEISINRYSIERGTGGVFAAVGSLQATGNTDSVVHYEFVDTPAPGVVYQYRVRQITNDGAQEYSPVIEVNTIASGVGPEGSTPQEYRLEQNFPNPFNPETRIDFSIVNPQFTTVRVYDLLGREVATLVNEQLGAGNHSVRFDSRGIASGAYIYRITAGGFTKTRRMMVLK